MGYREDWFRHNRPNIFGKYRCVRCGRMFSKDRIEIDHRIPKKHGGTDDISNLRPMCRSCNRRKSDKFTTRDVVTTVGKSLVKNGIGGVGATLGSMAKQGIKNNINDGLERSLGKNVGSSISKAIGTKYKR